MDTLIVKKDAETQIPVFQSDQNVEARPEGRDEEVQNSTVRENRTTQAMPSTQDIGTGELLALQKSMGVGNHIETDEKGMGEPLETKNRSAQGCPDQEDKSVQDEGEISISFSNLPKINLSFFSEEEQFDRSKSLSLSLASQHRKNLLDEIQTVKSEFILSSKSKSIDSEDSEPQELSPKSIVKKQKSFHIEDIPLEVSIYPSFNQSLVESEVIESKILEKSKSLSLKKSASQKEIEDMSFDILDQSPKSVKKKPLDDLSFDIIEEASRKSSFSLIKSEEEM